MCEQHLFGKNTIEQQKLVSCRHGTCCISRNKFTELLHKRTDRVKEQMVFENAKSPSQCSCETCSSFTFLICYFSITTKMYWHRHTYCILGICNLGHFLKLLNLSLSKLFHIWRILPLQHVFFIQRYLNSVCYFVCYTLETSSTTHCESYTRYPAVFSHALTRTFSRDFTKGVCQEKLIWTFAFSHTATPDNSRSLPRVQCRSESTFSGNNGAAVLLWCRCLHTPVEIHELHNI